MDTSGGFARCGSTPRLSRPRALTPISTAAVTKRMALPTATEPGRVNLRLRRGGGRTSATFSTTWATGSRASQTRYGRDAAPHQVLVPAGQHLGCSKCQLTSGITVHRRDRLRHQPRLDRQYRHRPLPFTLCRSSSAIPSEANLASSSPSGACSARASTDSSRARSTRHRTS